jgi:hypothetical protein
MRRAVPISSLAALLACAVLAGCGDNPQAPLVARGIGGGIGSTDASTLAACDQHADQVYDQRNRADIYQPQSSVNSPFSGNYVPGITNRGLSDQYARNAMIRDCVRNTGTQTSRSVPVPPSTEPAIKP